MFDTKVIGNYSEEVRAIFARINNSPHRLMKTVKALIFGSRPSECDKLGESNSNSGGRYSHCSVSGSRPSECDKLGESNSNSGGLTATALSLAHGPLSDKLGESSNKDVTPLLCLWLTAL